MASALVVESANQPDVAPVLSEEELVAIDAYWRAANYCSVGQIYLMDNPLLTGLDPVRRTGSLC